MEDIRNKKFYFLKLIKQFWKWDSEIDELKTKVYKARAESARRAWLPRASSP